MIYTYGKSMLNKNILILNSPALEWRDSWPSGNGQIGTLVSGDVYNEEIIINHENLWLNGEVLDLPDVSKSLSKVRELIEQKKYKDAHNYHRDILHKQGYKPQMAEFSPVCTLELRNKNTEPYSDYERSLNMETGEVSIKWKVGEKTFSRNQFVSRSSGNIYCSINSSNNDSLNYDINLTPLAGQIDSKYLEDHKLQFSKLSENEFMVIKGKNDKGIYFEAFLYIKSEGGSRQVEGELLQIRNSKNIQIEVEVFTGTSTYESITEYMSFNYLDELKKHSAIHGELYNRLKLKLDGKDMKQVQKMFDFGRFLLISSAGSALPPNLQGLWNGDKHPIWNCFYMLNENVQMMHWQVLPGNMSELMYSLFDYYESHLNDFKENAQKLFGCKGIFIPANTVPETGLITDLQGHLIYWTGGAAWLCRLYYDFYLYTEDLNFLQNRALPFMKETADFYESFTFENQKGELEFSPSISPENSPEDFNHEFKMDAECNVTINSTMDIALCKELLTNLINGSVICGLYGEKLTLWKEMIAKLPEYTINKDGAICEWIHKDFLDNYHHRHVSHIYPFFPGTEISIGNEMVPSIEKAVEKRFEIGMKEQTGWSVVHLANIYARLGRGNKALECLDILKKHCTGVNLFTYHNDWREGNFCQAKPKGFNKRVFQIDANMGYPAAILEMIVYSEPGKITLLPGLPSSMTEGEISGLLCRGNILLDIKWNKTSITGRLKSKTDKSINICSPLITTCDTCKKDLESEIWQYYNLDI